MNLTDRHLSPTKWLLVQATAGLALGGVGVCAWFIARLGPSSVEKPAPRPRTTSTSAHREGPVQFDLLAKLLADDRRSAPPDEWLRQLADSKAPFRTPTQSHPLLGRSAPDFTLDDSLGHRWNLHEQLTHGPVVLVFYLGYYCNYCVHDLFELNADLDRFHLLGAEVVAISGDAPNDTRRGFAQFGSFNYPVLSDPGHAVAQVYGMHQPATQEHADQLWHGTVIVAPDGRVRWVHFGERPFRVNMALLYELSRLETPLAPRSAAFQAESAETKTP